MRFYRFVSTLRLGAAVFTVLVAAAFGALYLHSHGAISRTVIESPGENVAVDSGDYHNLTSNFKHAVNRVRYS